MTTPLDDDARDAHLRAALRHAPDHDLAAPNALTERILARAASAVGAHGRPGWLAGLRRSLAALAQPRPAAALASLALATVVGLMWREGPPPEAPADRVAAASTPPPAGTASVAEAPLPAPAAAKLEAPPPPAAPTMRRAPPAIVDRVPKSMPAPTEPRRAERRRDEAPSAGAITAVPAPPNPPAAAAAPPAAPARAEPQAAAASESRSITLPAAEMARGFAGPAPMNAQLAAKAAPDAVATATNPLRAAVAALLRAGEAGARWQTAGSALKPLNAAAMAWLQDVQRQAAGRWQTGSGAELSANALVFSGEAGLLGRLEVVDGGVLWQPAGTPGATWFAALPPATVQALRDGLAAWAQQ